jgi:hypothetical protein
MIGKVYTDEARVEKEQTAASQQQTTKQSCNSTCKDNTTRRVG